MKLEFRGGNAIIVNFQERSGWSGRYKIDCRGMTDVQAAAKVQEIHEHHDKKAACLDRFRSLFGVEFAVNGDTYRVVGCTIWEFGGGLSVQLHIELRRIDDKELRKVEGFPLTITYATIDEVPSNPEIMALIIVRLDAGDQRKAVHADFQASVKQILGIG